MDKYIQLDEEGYFQLEQKRIVDVSYGNSLLKNLKVEPLSACYTYDGQNKILVEAFDSPLVVYQIHPLKNQIWQALTPYEYTFNFKLDDLFVDEWDRFLGYDSQKRPFVMTRSAQADFFNLVDEFDDDSVTYQGQKFEIGPWLKSPVNTQSKEFWNKKYQEEKTPGWEMNKASPPLVKSLPQLKINKSRILVPGCGSGNDAAFLAEQGHLVTAIDYSEEAIAQAQKKYGHLKNLKFQNLDVFNLPEDFNKSFDIIFEHTLFCAVPFERRQDLVKVYRQTLEKRGYLLGVFFVMEQKTHPPFGGSEWEYRKRLQNHFHMLYWTRWKESESWRNGIELVIYAQMKENI
ncbi:MAG: methyltransferase domain-containing protein [Bdellovibrionaceae bacterium]|nr:methyltransferase domain-containing protein [Pseudobdellovibrionaceae bacterium]